MSVFRTLFIAVIATTLLAACSSAERRAYRSQEGANKSQVELNERKMEIVDEYEKCIDKSSSDEDRAKCEAKLKGAQGL
jgi:outer membrane biogenesis lipoprotein LolB